MNLGSSDFLERTILLCGQFDEQVEETLAAVLRPGAVFYDVGANIGYYTLRAARLVGQAGQVIAFEPHPGACTRLRRNVVLNGLTTVRVFELGLSDTTGEATLHVPAGNAGGASLVPVEKTIAPPQCS